MNQAIPHPLLQNAEAFAPYGENQSARIDLAEEAQALQADLGAVHRGL